MAKTIFEEIGGTYVRRGDYELPAVTLPPEEEIHVGIWGQRYRRWLNENHRVLYYNLFTSGKLNEQIAEVDERAEKLFSRMVQELAEDEGVTEDLKASDTMAWIRRMNNTKFQLKQDNIQARPVMLRIVSEVREHMQSQRRVTTFSRVEKTSLRKPLLRNSFQICSIGFISGVYGGIKNSRIFEGTDSDPALCHAAPSQHSRIISLGFCLERCSKKMFMQTVLQ